MSVLQKVLSSLRPGVVAMIASAGVSILVSAFWGNETVILWNNINWSLVVIFLICILLLLKFKMNPIAVMMLAGVIKVGIFLIQNYVYPQ